MDVILNAAILCTNSVGDVFQMPHLKFHEWHYSSLLQRKKEAYRTLKQLDDVVVSSGMTPKPKKLRSLTLWKRILAETIVFTVAIQNISTEIEEPIINLGQWDDSNQRKEKATETKQTVEQEMQNIALCNPFYKYNV